MMKWEPQRRQVISWLWVNLTHYFHKWPRQESASGIWSNKNGIKCNSAKCKYHAWGWVARVLLTEDLDGNDRLFFKSVMEKTPSTLGLESQSLSSSVSDQICPRYPGETYAWAYLLIPPLGHPKSCLPLLRKGAFNLEGGRRSGQRGMEDRASSFSPRAHYMGDSWNQARRRVGLNWWTLLAQEHWIYVLYAKADEPGILLQRRTGPAFLLWHLVVEWMKNPSSIMNHRWSLHFRYTFTTCTGLIFLKT